MNIKSLCAIVMMVVVPLLYGPGLVSAQVGQNAGTKAATQAKKTIGFRSVAWQHKHIHDMDAAAKLIESLEKIGCEVVKEDHNGHLDVKFRCATWKSITVDSDKFATQWTEWLVGNGMETVMVDPPATPGLEIVKFRLAEWKNIHLHNADQVDQTLSMLKLIGCEADKHEHDGHFDVRFRTGDWMTIALHNHAAAHSWQEWLNNMGFETQHSH